MANQTHNKSLKTNIFIKKKLCNPYPNLYISLVVIRNSYKSLHLQELIDMTNEVEKKGVIYFKDFCMLILRKFREEDEEEFIKIMFKVIQHEQAA